MSSAMTGGGTEHWVDPRMIRITLTANLIRSETKVHISTCLLRKLLIILIC